MAAPVEKGQILAGKYRVEKVLGEGGMGVVVAATDTQLERRVAIKFLLPEYAKHPEASARFMREARAAVKIQSEHIARVIDVNEMDNGSPYMVMEYLQGSDLSQALERSGPMTVENAVLYVIQACDAIAEAHSYGIVHRDLKPANLFLAKQPGGSSKVKVLDFGISKNTVAASEGTDASLTRTSSMMGSPLYMSPEQMRSTKDVDSRTDIWALGVILYELLTGKLPFDANSIPELSAKILLEDPDPMTREDVPKALKNVIERALSKKPEGRFPTIAEFSMAIAPYASKNARANVERISRILTAAGLSDSQYDLPPSIPPTSLNEMEETRLSTVDVEAYDPSAQATSGPRQYSGTVSQWGRTQGPEIPGTKSLNIPVWAAAAAAGALLVGGGLFFVLGSSDTDAAAAAQPTLPAETQPQHEVQAEAREAIAKPAADATQDAEQESDKADEKEAEAAQAAQAEATEEPEPEVTPEPEPKPTAAPVAPKPRTVAKKPVARAKPAPKPASPKSIKDKFGSRK